MDLARRTFLGASLALPVALTGGCRGSTDHLTVYTSMARAITDRITASFEKAGLPVRFWRANSPEVAKRVMLEARRGIAGCDVVEGETGLLARLAREFQYLRPLPDDIRPIDGLRFGALSRVRANCVAWNTRAVPPALAPRSYGDLLRPEFRRKIVVVDTAVPWFHALHERWGAAKAQAYFAALARQGVRASSGHSLTAELLASGEFAVSPALYDYAVAAMKKRGDPVDFRLCAPVPLIQSGWAINARSPNRTLAERFIRHMQQGGQAILRDANVVAGSPRDFLRAYPQVAEADVAVDTIEGSDAFPEWADRMRAFLKAAEAFR